jgi:hypothetical protein
VDAFESLFAALTQDSDGIDYAVDAIQPWKPSGGVQVAREITRNMSCGIARLSAHFPDFVASLPQRTGEMSSDETRRAGEKDDHSMRGCL